MINIFRRHRSRCYLLFFHYVIVGWNIYAANAANWNCVVKNAHTDKLVRTHASRTHQHTQNTFDEFSLTYFGRCPFTRQHTSKGNNVIIITARHSPFMCIFDSQNITTWFLTLNNFARNKKSAHTKYTYKTPPQNNILYSYTAQLE